MGKKPSIVCNHKQPDAPCGPSPTEKIADYNEKSISSGLASGESASHLATAQVSPKLNDNGRCTQPSKTVWTRPYAAASSKFKSKSSRKWKNNPQQQGQEPQPRTKSRTSKSFSSLRASRRRARLRNRNSSAKGGKPSRWKRATARLAVASAKAVFGKWSRLSHQSSSGGYSASRRDRSQRSGEGDDRHNKSSPEGVGDVKGESTRNGSNHDYSLDEETEHIMNTRGSANHVTARFNSNTNKECSTKVKKDACVQDNDKNHILHSPCHVPKNEKSDASQEFHPRDKATQEDGLANFILAWGILAAILWPQEPKTTSKEEKNENEEKFSGVLCHDNGNVVDDKDLAPSPPLDDLSGFITSSGEDPSSPNLQYKSPDEEASETNSIPSLSLDDDVNDADPTRNGPEIELDINGIINVPSRTKSNEKELTNSVIAWGALTAFLGSPAPSSVIGKENRKNKSVWNLWGREEASDVPLLSFNEVEEDEQNPLHVSPRSQPEKQEDEASLAHSIPSISDADCPTQKGHYISTGVDTSFNDLVDYSKESRLDEKDVTGSVIAWSTLAAFMASPAPLPVTRNDSTSERNVVKNLWGDSEDADNDTLDMIILPQESHHDTTIKEDSINSEDKTSSAESAHSYEPDTDNDSMPSLVSTDHGNDISPGTTDALFNEPLTFAKNPSNEIDITGSMMTWGALAAFMGSSAPGPIARKISKEKNVIKNLWEESEVSGDDSIDLIQL